MAQSSESNVEIETRIRKIRKSDTEGVSIRTYFADELQESNLTVLNNSERDEFVRLLANPPEATPAFKGLMVTTVRL